VLRGDPPRVLERALGSPAEASTAAGGVPGREVRLPKIVVIVSGPRLLLPVHQVPDTGLTITMRASGPD
jgi:hypothetical protein